MFKKRYVLSTERIAISRLYRERRATVIEASATRSAGRVTRCPSARRRCGLPLTLKSTFGIGKPAMSITIAILNDVRLARTWMARATMRFQKQRNALQP
jgi:hypothetical protein